MNMQKTKITAPYPGFTFFNGSSWSQAFVAMESATPKMPAHISGLGVTQAGGLVWSDLSTHWVDLGL